MPTYSSALLPTTSGLTFGSAALRWTAYLQDMDVAGTPTFTGRVGIKDLEDIRFVDQYAGGTVTQQIDAAITDANTTGGGLVVVPSSMGAGSATSINGLALLDLRGGGQDVFALYNNNVSTPQFSIQTNRIFIGTLRVGSGSPLSPGVGAIGIGNNTGLVWRNASNNGNILGIYVDTSNITNVGTSTGVKIIGPTSLTGALSGVTTGSFSGQITSSLATGTAPFAITSTTVVPNLNVATLNGVTVSGAPSGSGASIVSTGTTTAAWSSGSGQYKLENLQYTPNTFISSAGGTLFTYSLPANELAVGQAIRIKSVGTYQNTSGGARTYTFTLKAGATTLVTSAFTTGTASVTNTIPWSLDYFVVCTAAGSSGTVEAQIQGAMTTQSASISTVINTGNSATVAFDTTTIQSLTLNVVQTNDATTGCTGRQWLVERVG